MKLESWDSFEEKKRWKIVRRDNLSNDPRWIISADEVTGKCQLVSEPDEQASAEAVEFGEDAIRILPR